MTTSLNPIDMNAYYDDFCTRVDAWAAEREKRFEDDPEPTRATIFHDEEGKITLDSDHVRHDMTLERLTILSPKKHPPHLATYAEGLEMRLFDLVATFQLVAQPIQHPDNILQIHARADGLIVRIEQSHQQLEDEHPDKVVDENGDPVTATKIESVRLYGAIRNDPSLAYILTRGFDAYFDEGQTGNIRNFSINIERHPGRIIDTIAPFVIAPWETTPTMFVTGQENFNGLEIPAPAIDFDEENFVENPEDDKIIKDYNAAVYAKSVVLEAQRSQKLPLHIRQMIGLESFVKNPEVFSRSSANSAYLVHYVPQKLRL